MTKKSTLPGRLTLLVKTSNSDPDNPPISIELVDEASGARLFDVEIAGQEFLLMLARGAMRPVTYTIWENQPIGYTVEVKHEEIVFPSTALERRRDAQEDPVAVMERVTSHEINGWRVIQRGSHADWYNGHRRVPGTDSSRATQTYKVAFRRFVHPTTGEIWEP